VFFLFIFQVRSADQIVVIADHSVSAMGTHESLLESSSIYADLVKRQLSAGMDKLPPSDASNNKPAEEAAVPGAGPSAVL
jgi:hypothetical protein